MASSGDDTNKFDQLGLYQQAGQELDKELSPDTWGSGNILNADYDWAGLLHLLPPDLPSENPPDNPYHEYFDQFEQASTMEEAFALPIPGTMTSDSLVTPGMQAPAQYAQQAVQQSPVQSVEQHPQQFAEQYPEQSIHQHPEQSVQQFPQQAVQQHPQYHPQQAVQYQPPHVVQYQPPHANQYHPQHAAQYHPQQVSQPTPRLAQQPIHSQGYNYHSHPIHQQIPPNAQMGANDQGIPAHQFPQNNVAKISPSATQNQSMVASTQASQADADAHNPTTPRSQTSGDSQPRSPMHAKAHNAEQKANSNINTVSQETQTAPLTANEIGRDCAGDLAQSQEVDDLFSETSQSPVNQDDVHDVHSHRHQESFYPPRSMVGRPAMGSMTTEGGLTVGPHQIPSFVPDIVDLLNPHHSGADTQTIFKDSKAAQEASCIVRADLLTRRDQTIPTTDEQKRAIVKALFKAMKNLQHAEDNPAMKRPFVHGKFPDIQLEAACWTLLDLTLLRHRQGPLLGPFSNKCRGGEALTTFGQRISLIITSLEVNKTIVKHVLDPNYTASLVDDPIGSMKRIVSNKQLNRRKGEYMTAGKELLQNEQNYSTKNNRRGFQRMAIRTTPTPGPVERPPTPVQTAAVPTQASGVVTRSQTRRAHSRHHPSPPSALNMAAHRPTIHRTTARESAFVHTPHAQHYPANYPMTPTRHAQTETQAMPNDGYRTYAPHPAYHPLGGLPVNVHPVPHARAPMNQNNLINYNDDTGSQEERASSPLFIGNAAYGCARAMPSLSATTHSRTPSTPHSGRGRKRQASDADFGSGPRSDKRRH